MTIVHHPSDELMADYVAGALDQGQRIAVAAHLAFCPACRSWARTLEAVGGAVIEDLPPTPLVASSFAPEDRRESTKEARSTGSEVADAPGLPAFLRAYSFGKWRWLGPGVHMRLLHLDDSPTRVFLLRSAAGAAMLQHSHSGVEMTCVLSGAFTHEAGRFGPGDFDFGDDDVEHRPVVDASEPCICLVAMTGGLKLKGFFGRLMQPFVRL